MGNLHKEIDSGKRFWFDFKKVDRLKLEEKTRKVNQGLRYIQTSNVSETNSLLKAGSVLIAKRLGLRNLLEDRKNKSFKEPWWKRRLQGDIKQLRYVISVLDRKLKGKLKKEWKLRELVRKFRHRY